ncbi:TraB/GumN family protein [Flavobacterium subsaxonicum]|uniref:Polysaccharide biosynthesis protein GumN n=1 Tax=Flavobacterium subsaxonicum WB 4.1-42 = DSM 21790 TaxID=1121898 RepID=A0A0A2MLU9_9FLAO|nr:TraB/GumN family protein [Flavobacterium subsaxonicum]KGO92463.1 hypothetical protein Q766_11815 [Flavobacterium subsaxonicum WB 4.1-42 = DSM 21790]
MKKLLFTVFGLLIALSASAQKSTDAAPQKLDKGLLWKITGKGISKPSYLLGTLHATCNLVLDDNILTALDNTQQLYLELDMDDPNLQTHLMAGMKMKNDVKMSSLAKPEEYAKVDAFLKATLGYPVQAVDGFMPLLVTSMLIPKMVDCEIQSVEGDLIKYTQDQQEQIYGLETVEDQLAVFDAVPYTEQMAELVKTANDNMAASKLELQRIMTLYKEKDLNAIYNFTLQEGSPMFAKHIETFLNNRNKNWVPKIEAVAKAKPTLFALGAAHLPGENGVIMLLRKKGYKVEVVK